MPRRPSWFVLVVVGCVLSSCGGGGTTTVIERTVVRTTQPTTTKPPNTTTTSATTSSTPGGRTERCPDVPGIGPTGAHPAPAINVTATNTDCATAAELARRFYRAWIPSGAAPGSYVTVDGFQCTELRSSGGFTARVECNHSASSVSFDLQ